ncbi:hypothetical protein SDC9_190098 [bioreactor metagenome]|uniref:Uncharacterized protein n=1 Tax=bioreactor metagenome TaxID=1076179 RepID=A0A645HU18_9ZZZZ
MGAAGIAVICPANADQPVRPPGGIGELLLIIVVPVGFAFHPASIILLRPVKHAGKIRALQPVCKIAVERGGYVQRRLLRRRGGRVQNLAVLRHHPEHRKLIAV